MVNKLKAAALACAGVLLISSAAGAADIKYRLAAVYSPHTTRIHAPGYLSWASQLPKDHRNGGQDYWGFLGEANLGKGSLNIDYLTGTSRSVKGGLDEAANSPTFNPLTAEQSETMTLYAGYTVLDNPLIGKVDVTLGYFRMWAQPSISPANWYDGIEYGVKGRREWKGGYALTYRLGYLPVVAAHGYVSDAGLMSGDNIWNFRAGGEAPVYKALSVIGGYESTRAENKVLVGGGSRAVVGFSGFYFGALYAF